MKKILSCMPNNPFEKKHTYISQSKPKIDTQKGVTAIGEYKECIVVFDDVSEKFQKSSFLSFHQW